METQEVYSDVREIEETTCVEDANERLRKGWRLLSVVKKELDGEYVVYVLGKPAA